MDQSNTKNVFNATRAEILLLLLKNRFAIFHVKVGASVKYGNIDKCCGAVVGMKKIQY